jgi:hypothetical protein
MADIATVFHWPLIELTSLGLAELIAWRDRARVRAEPAED